MDNNQSSIVNKTPIVFFGAGPYVVSVIETLNKNFELALIVTTETDPNSPILKFCKSNNIGFISISSFSSEIVNGQLSMVNCQIAVLASFGLIIPDEIVNMFELGIINIHPSLLPKYRGPTPGQTAILNGETTTGVSIIKLDEQVDHGPILVQSEEKIEPDDTSESLYKRMFKLGAELIVRDLPKYIASELTLTEQDHSKATFTEHLSRESGFIDINNQSSIIKNQLNRKIRAYYPWPGVWFKAKLNGVERTIKLLPEQKIQVEGKNIMQLSDFANGYPEGRPILSQLLPS